jgi:oligopeptide/dipeptide ABC transporter ATP-binding protein
MKLAPAPLLEVRHLSVSYVRLPETVCAVRDVSLELCEGETLVLAGETGSGKSTLALALLHLKDDALQVTSGEILFEGRDYRSFQRRDWQDIYGRKIGMIFQDSGSALNPILTVRDQIVETLRAHQKISKKAAQTRAMELLDEVGIAREKGTLYPFELSGGMCQRVGIALGICNQPRLLIADEPTSALDLTLQYQIMDLLGELKRRYGMAFLLISHDLPMISRIADRISIMYHGRIVESGMAEEILHSPAHPYTRKLIACQPGLNHQHETNPLPSIAGAAPKPGEQIAGCSFAPRCEFCEPVCKEADPSSRYFSNTHRAACLSNSAAKGK